MAGVDQRRHPRVPFTRSVRIRLSSGTVVLARAINISQAGIAVSYDAPAEIGAKLEVAFTLQVRAREIEVRQRCVACYNHLSGQGYVIGLQFQDLDDSLRENLREFVAIKRSLKD